MPAPCIIQCMRCQRTKWHGRPAWTLANDILQLTHLSGGGHIVDFHLLSKPSVSPLWVPRWKTQEPSEFNPKTDTKKFGAPEVGKLLSGIAGHTLCLDLFGMPSPDEIKNGATLHGEAGVLTWQISGKKEASASILTARVSLPKAGLSFVRELTLREGEGVVYVRETVRNERPTARHFQWQQHVTLGPPFFSGKDCSINLPGARGRTFPQGYEGRDALARDEDFAWPYAPKFDRGRLDLRRVLLMDRRGFVAAVQVAPQRDQGFVCALNARLSLAFGYVFRRKDFPWVALWEENRARVFALERARTSARVGVWRKPSTHDARGEFRARETVWNADVGGDSAQGNARSQLSHVPDSCAQGRVRNSGCERRQSQGELQNFTVR